MPGRGLSWKCALLLIRTRGWVCGRALPEIIRFRTMPQPTQKKPQLVLREPTADLPMNPWERFPQENCFAAGDGVRGQKRDRGTLPLPSDSSLILPRNWLREKGL